MLYSTLLFNIIYRENKRQKHYCGKSTKSNENKNTNKQDSASITTVSHKTAKTNTQNNTHPKQNPSRSWL